jgi:hypothetical protein
VDGISSSTSRLFSSNIFLVEDLTLLPPTAVLLFLLTFGLFGDLGDNSSSSTLSSSEKLTLSCEDSESEDSLNGEIGVVG